MSRRIIRARQLLFAEATSLETAVDRLVSVLEILFMGLQPLYDRVVIKRTEAETKTTGGILLPDNARNKPQKVTQDQDRCRNAARVCQRGTELFGQCSRNWQVD